MTITGDNGNLSIDFLVGFTIFLLAFIWVVSMIPGLLINLQGYTIDYDAVAYRTGVILAEDPGEPSLPTSINAWENLLSKEGVVRFGLAVSKDTPNILSQKKVDRFFCSSVFSYPVDYQTRTIFGDYPYQFNISLVEMGSDHPPLFVGDIMPATSSYGSIRRLVKIKEPSIAVINASSYDITGNYDPTARGELLSGENETVHEFIILINKSELLEDTVRDPIYQINPARERTIINITHLDQTMPLDRKDCFNISLTKITIINEMGGLFVTPPIPNYQSVIDGVQYNQSSTKPFINNNISLLFDPPTYWSVTDKSYINLTFTLTPNSTCSGPGGIFSGPDPVRGSRFLNNTLTSPFGYNYSPKNVIQPQLRDAVLEIKIGSGARTVTETVTAKLVAEFTPDLSGGLSVIFIDQSIGNPVEWDWDFGDGTPHGTTNNPTHTYASQGIKTVKLIIKDTVGVSDSISKTIDLSAPVAGFNGTPLSGNEPLNVQFTDISTGGAPTSWKWEFNKTSGGGWTQFNTSKNPRDPINEGVYDIRLTATNIFGSNTLTQFSYITVFAAHNITATAGAGGTITPSGEVSVAYGTNQVFTITPNAGYHITDVVVDSISQGVVSSYTFNNVVATHTISATFAINSPTFGSINPNSGTTLGGTLVTITGTNLTGATGVTFDGIAATGITVVDANTINATTPAHAAGAVNVVITTPGGTATGTGAFTYSTSPLTGIGAITGSLQVGSVLTAGALAPVGATATYQWQSSAALGGPYANIAGATATTYTTVAIDVGKYIRVTATGTGAYTGTVNSAGLGPITTPLTGIGAITGSLQGGSVLTAGALAPVGATATYQWQSSAALGGPYVNIAGATATTYTTLAGDVGRYIRVTATGTGAYTGTVNSVAVGPVTAIPITLIGAPTGSLMRGNILTAGALTPAGATATYRWQSSAALGGPYANIAGATSATYTTVVGDVGRYIRVRATGTAAYTGTVNSAAVGPVT